MRDMTLGNYKTLRVGRSDDGYVVTVELNRPEVLNAMNTAMGEDLLACFEALFWDKSVRAVVLTGAGEKAFCVGADLKEREGMTAVRQTKKAIAWGADTDLETGMILAIEAYNNTISTEDRLEGVRAFNEKRKPRFQGK